MSLAQFAKTDSSELPEIHEIQNGYYYFLGEGPNLVACISAEEAQLLDLQNVQAFIDDLTGELEGVRIESVDLVFEFLTGDAGFSSDVLGGDALVQILLPIFEPMNSKSISLVGGQVDPGTRVLSPLMAAPVIAQRLGVRYRSYGSVADAHRAIAELREPRLE